MRSSLLSVGILLAVILQIASSEAPQRYKVSRYHTRGRSIQNEQQQPQPVVQSRILRAQNWTKLITNEKTVAKVPESKAPVLRSRSRNVDNSLRNRVPITKFRPWRGNVKRRPRRPLRGLQQRQQRQRQTPVKKQNQDFQISEGVQKAQENERNRIRRNKRRRRPVKSSSAVMVEKNDGDDEKNINRRSFARKIVEGMLMNVRGGARLISARGNYGYVPLVNKLIDNATLIRENIKEGFDCADKTYGYYADQLNDCQLFHICVPMKQIFPDHFTEKDVYHFSFICPKQTIFSQDAMVCAWQNGAVPCVEAHNLYYMNKNFFVVTNDVKKETTTTTSPPNLGGGAYPSSAVGNPQTGPIITSGPDAITPTGSAVVTGSVPAGGYGGSSSVAANSGNETQSVPATGYGSSSVASPGPANSGNVTQPDDIVGPVVAPGSAYPSPNERG